MNAKVREAVFARAQNRCEAGGCKRKAKNLDHFFRARESTGDGRELLGALCRARPPEDHERPQRLRVVLPLPQALRSPRVPPSSREGSEEGGVAHRKEGERSLKQPVEGK